MWNHSDKFSGHRYCDSRDIMGLVCHVILLDHVIKGTRDYLPSVRNVALMWFIM